MSQSAIIQTLWIGGRLSTMEQLSLVSFLKNGHPVHLYTYEEVQDVPEGVELKDAGEIVSRDRIFTYKKRQSFAGFADLFRFKLVLETGHFWCDTDVICLRPVEIADPHVYISELERRRLPIGRQRTLTTSAVIRAPRSAEVMQYCYDVALAADPAKIQWGDIGPRLVAEAVDKFGLQQYVLAPSAFCPIPFWQWKDVLAGSGRARNRAFATLDDPRVFGIHLWNEMWRRDRVDKDARFPENSLFEHLKRKYLG